MYKRQRQDRVSARLFGYAKSPHVRRLAQNAKAGAGPGEDATLDAVARQIAAGMQPDRLYILGPGTTTRRVSHALGLPSTLLGVDAVLNGALVGQDPVSYTHLDVYKRQGLGPVAAPVNGVILPAPRGEKTMAPRACARTTVPRGDGAGR